MARPDQRIPLELNERERELIVRHSFAPDELTRRLRVVPKPGQSLVCRFTLEDWDELAGYVVSEANHAKNKKIEREWRELFARIDELLSAYTDEAS